MSDRKMTPREVMHRALVDAIKWQFTLAAASPQGSPERQQAQALEAEYRAMMKRRYGTSRTPAERALDGLSTISLHELMERHGSA